ncbi:hypothetical protein BVC93_17435 [Mycobacterium sp. MS1601]|uniref:hypothetical protein n=1 Tax=Mycobacterium sp. MS1601 TaxID=1936029 RepID=UPI0009797044|nr:hypothetical protein [Mycobacterium sp. MS1601]AQA03916.1 hypothetical protein BVC93_17435 [Mycobacterium sp. MS1601]
MAVVDSSSEPQTAADRNTAAETALRRARDTWSDPKESDSQPGSSGGLNSGSNENSVARQGSNNDSGSKSGKKDQQKNKTEKKKKRQTQAQKKHKKKDGR